MTNKRKLKGVKKELKRKKQLKMKREFDERVSRKVRENLNADVKLVMLKGTDPAVLLGTTKINERKYNLYLSYRKDDINTYMVRPKKEGEIFDLPHYLVVIDNKNSSLVTGEFAQRVINQVRSEVADSEVERKFETLKTSIATAGMINGLTSFIPQQGE